MGGDLLLNSLAAIVVGGTSLAGGSGGPLRTLIGVLIIAILDNGLNLLGVGVPRKDLDAVLCHSAPRR